MNPFPTMKTTITVPKDQTRPVRLAVSPETFSALRSGGSAFITLPSRTDSGAVILPPGARIEVRRIGARSRQPETLAGCVVGRRIEAYPADTLPPGSVPAGHRGPALVLSLVTDTHAEALAAVGPLSELLPHYVPPAAA